ncbi:ALP1-like protein [Tanacetum coccineum]|uniref:ALP1-like protein n=1 Tax=Tanacetum coccineum TaxID=301880 RepID=A0ABQ5DTB5_9ASTR
MNLNANDEYENLFDADDETDLWFMTKAIECHLLMQQEGQGSTSRNPIYREYKDAEEAGANNDLTVFNNSPLFDDLLNNIALVAPFLVNGVQYEKGYYLGDGMYLQWATFVESFTVARDEKLGFLNGDNKLQERMSNEFLVFSKDVGELYNIRRILIISTRYEESCIVASYCII